MHTKLGKIGGFGLCYLSGNAALCAPWLRWREWATPALWCLVIILCVGGAVFDWDAIGVVTGLAAVGGTVFYFIYRLLVNNFPLSMGFTDQPREMDIREQRTPVRSVYGGSLGAQTVRLIIKTCKETELRKFDVRLKPWRVDSLHSAPLPHIKQAELKALSVALRGKDVSGAINPSLYGGLEFILEQPALWPADSELWIDLAVEAKQPWSGIISFSTDMDRPVFARRRVKFREKK